MRFPFLNAGSDEPFWPWFAAHADEIAAVRTGRERVAVELRRRFLRECPELTFEVGIAPEGGDREFVISADGIRDQIPAVRRMVASAPAIPGWRVTAFRPRHASDSVQIGGLTLRRDVVRFVVAEATPGQPLDVVILIPGFPPDKPDQHIHAAFLLLDGILGEYDVMSQLGDIDFRPLGAGFPHARPLSELAEVVDSRR